MRFAHVTEDLFSNQTTIRLLRTLIRNPQREFSGRTLALESRTPPLRAIESLRRLERQGLVHSHPAGRAHLWMLRNEHALRPALQGWFDFERGLRASLFEEIRASLAPLPAVRKAVVFGSIARGDDRPTSDVDLFILVDASEHKPLVVTALEGLRERVRRTFTNPLRPLIYDQREFERKRHLGVVRNIEREGVVLVAKQPIKTERLAHGKARTYLRKAEEFARLMEPAASRGDWNAVGLAAVHSVISCADALTTQHLGIRSRSDDHEDVVDLLRNLPVRNAAGKADQALEVLRAKNQVEYEARDFEAQEAKATMKKALRLLQWAREEMSP